MIEGGETTGKSKSFGNDISDAIILYVEIDGRDVHFLDAIIKGYPGIANVRRDYRVYGGKTYYKILTSPDFMAETKEVIRRLRDYIHIGHICTGDDVEK